MSKQVQVPPEDAKIAREWFVKISKQLVDDERFEAKHLLLVAALIEHAGELQLGGNGMPDIQIKIYSAVAKAFAKLVIGEGWRANLS